MRKLEKIYNDILRRHNELTDVDINIKKDICIEQCLEGTYNILNEYVKDPDFTPVPKEFLNEMCSLVKFSKESVVKISFKHLYELLKEYDYEYFNEFKMNLKKRSLLNGDLYIIILGTISDDIIPFNDAFNLINSYVNDEVVAERMFNEIVKNRDIDALCSIRTGNENEFFNKNAMIYISLFAEFPKDSLEHELTHFIQKIVGLDKSLSKQFTSSDFNSFMLKDANKAKQLYSFVQSLSKSNNTTSMLINFFKMKFNSKEFDQSVKAVLNGFQRIYENDKLDYVDDRLEFDKNVKNRVEANNDKSLRMKWLEDFIDIIESSKFRNDYLIPVLNSEYDSDYFRKNRSYFMILLYLGFKIMFNFDIKDRLFKHFETFKYRDN